MYSYIVSVLCGIMYTYSSLSSSCAYTLVDTGANKIPAATLADEMAFSKYEINILNSMIGSPGESHLSQMAQEIIGTALYQWSPCYKQRDIAEGSTSVLLNGLVSHSNQLDFLYADTLLSMVSTFLSQNRESFVGVDVWFDSPGSVRSSLSAMMIHEYIDRHIRTTSDKDLVHRYVSDIISSTRCMDSLKIYFSHSVHTWSTVKNSFVSMLQSKFDVWHQQRPDPREHTMFLVFVKHNVIKSWWYTHSFMTTTSAMVSFLPSVYALPADLSFIKNILQEKVASIIDATAGAGTLFFFFA